ncbi:DUF2807 domain-containing protein [Antarcticibacterium sp. 1MA-6-2]|uniref:GIN domain-containing protein n=1 Tax=Antarcticibacterium sp. 1MA-6-2 TaxID=2908210 RepID=UPI001F42D968|nr:DUF2807 domain-containing protein [Antarcticibacterium sp. 1MA-6-2]UJH92348.1 DUF2807 domain-containing protein [Antarcticibacterium sp. 1MA-6-2]
MRSKSNISLILPVILILMTGVSCNDNSFIYHEEEFELKNFEGVRLVGAFNVEIRQAKEFSVKAKGKKENLKNLQLEVVDGTLTASCSPGNSNLQETILEITMPVLKSADLHGATSSIITGFNESRENITLVVT